MQIHTDTLENGKGSHGNLTHDLCFLNPLVPDRTLKYVFSEKSFRYSFSHNSSISYAILKIQKAATPQDPRASFW